MTVFIDRLARWSRVRSGVMSEPVLAVLGAINVDLVVQGSAPAEGWARPSSVERSHSIRAAREATKPWPRLAPLGTAGAGSP